MNLGRHLAVLWRFRVLTIAGVVLGVVLAILASYQVSLGGGSPKLTPRGTEQWSTTSSVLVTQTGFPWGRVTLGNDNAPQVAGAPAPKAANGQEFADPGRFSNLAMLYSVISYSDSVRRALPEHPTADQIVAVPWDATGNGTTFLPIVRLTTKATTADGARKLNFDASAALRNLLTEQQRANGIPNKQRVKLSVLNSPSDPLLVRGRSHTASILAFMLIMLCTIALAHVLEAIRPARGAPDGPRIASAPDLEVRDERETELPATAMAPSEDEDREPARAQVRHQLFR